MHRLILATLVVFALSPSLRAERKPNIIVILADDLGYGDVQSNNPERGKIHQPIPRDAMYWEHGGNAAVRVGDMKLVRQGRDGVWELYDLKTDRTELHNLAAAQPEKAQELAAKWEDWAERAHVKPYPGEANGSAKKSRAKKAGAADEK